MNDQKWRDLTDQLGGRARRLVAGLSDQQLCQVWLATTGLLGRPSGLPSTSPLLSTEIAFEAALQRFREALAGDERSSQAFGRLVREGYVAHREEHLAGFMAGLDRPGWREVSALACRSYRRRGMPAREAVLRAHRVAFDRAHHPDPAVRGEAARTLGAAQGEVENSPDLRQAVDRFVTDHLGTLDGLLRAC